MLKNAHLRRCTCLLVDRQVPRPCGVPASTPQSSGFRAPPRSGISRGSTCKTLGIFEHPAKTQFFTGPLEQPVPRQQGLPPIYRNILFDGLPPAAQIGIPATINQAVKNIGRAPVPWNHTPMPEEYGNSLFVHLFPLCPGF